MVPLSLVRFEQTAATHVAAAVASQQPPRDAGGAGRERVDDGAPEGAAGLHGGRGAGGEIGQAPHARENGPGAPFGCLDGAGKGVRPSAEGVDAGRGGYELAQLAIRLGAASQWAVTSSGCIARQVRHEVAGPGPRAPARRPPRAAARQATPRQLPGRPWFGHLSRCREGRSSGSGMPRGFPRRKPRR